MWVVPEGLVHYLCWVTICLEDLFHSPITLVAWQTFLALVSRHLMMLDLMVVRVIVHISICVCLFTNIEVVARVPFFSTSTSR